MAELHWVLVTGAALKLKDEETELAKEVGTMLAREGYGLIVGDWPGVDELTLEAFLQAVPASEQSRRVKHIDNYGGRGRRVPGAVVLKDEGGTYSPDAVEKAHAGIIVSGRQGAMYTMQALLRQGKPVLPIPFLGWDAFEVFCEMLRKWNERPVKGLTERQFLELMKPWSCNPTTLSRLLRASLATEPEIFISYRRDDVPAAAGRVFDELVQLYGRRSVFIDYDGLPGGMDIHELLRIISVCKVVVALIGPAWDIDRLQQPQDFVRLELETANKCGLTVIPVLIGKASLPATNQLPPKLAFLRNLNTRTLLMEDWTKSLPDLTAAVDLAMARPRTPSPP